MPHNPHTSFRDLNDGIVTGRIDEKRGTCQICMTDNQCVLVVADITLPKMGPSALKKKVKPSVQLKFYTTTVDGDIVPVSIIGLTCGCYAKAHRQLARIDQRMKGTK